MSDTQDIPVPSEIKLHQRTRRLELAYGDGSRYELPAEYLRVFSPAALMSGALVKGKEDVTIVRLLPEGNRGIKPVFNDGHDLSVYTWADLHDLAVNQEDKWALYLRRLEAEGYSRKDHTGPRVRLLYFVKLVPRLGREHEEVRLPETVSTVQSLLAWLRKRGGNWETYLGDDQVKVTVNKQFAKLDTPIQDGDEIAIVPSHTH